MTSSIDVSVVIPAYNAEQHIAHQLDAVRASVDAMSGAEILVVDNRSTDGTPEAVRHWSSSTSVPIRLVAADERAGEPHARNVGWQNAHGSCVLYCDADDVVSVAWARSLLAALAEAPYATGPLRTDRINPPWMANIRGAVMHSRPILRNTVPYAHGCNMGFRRETLENLGGFDERFLIACDIEIAIRAWRAGLPLAYSRDAVVDYRLRPWWLPTYRQGRSYGRSRWRIDALVPELVNPGQERLAVMRRLLWLMRRAPRACIDRETRARWVWVCAQLDGQVLGHLERRRGR